MSKDALGYYAILKIGENFSDDEIKQNYRDLAKFWHPDYNQTVEAKDNFQKLAVAYDTLTDSKKKIIYDVLSLVYNQNNFPDVSVIKAYENMEHQAEINLRAIYNAKVFGKIFKYSVHKDNEVCNFAEAKKLVFLTSVSNWLLGWWHPKAFVENIKALVQNYQKMDIRQKNLTLFLHNAVAYYNDNKTDGAITSLELAKRYASAAELAKIAEFQNMLGSTSHIKIKEWNFGFLRFLQLIVPLTVLLVLGLSWKFSGITESELWQRFYAKKDINYYHEVNLYGRQNIIDDTVFSKIVNIPIDTDDHSKLYHLVSDTAVMFGPDDNFDVLKTLKADTTVRITGKTPDDKWFRILIDSGDMGFVRENAVKQGIGRAIPYGSKVK